MRLRNKLFLTWGGLVLLLWAGTLLPVRHTIDSSFDRLARANFDGTRQSLAETQAQRIIHMRQAGRLVMNIPELRALIAEHQYEVAPANLASLKERLDNLSSVIGVNFMCVLDSRGDVIAQNHGSPWTSLEELQEYLHASPQAIALLTRLFAPTGHDPQADVYGLWASDKGLFHVVAVPLRFASDNSESPADIEGALVLAVPITDALAAELGKSHDCQLTFLAGTRTIASSLPQSAREDLERNYARFQSRPTQDFDLTLGKTTFRSSVEPLLDPCSGQPVADMLMQSDMADAQVARSSLWRTLLIILAAGLVVTAVGSFLLSSAMTRPVQALLAGVRRVATGDLELSLPVKSRDELGALGSAFNDMVIQLRSRRQLERLVEESQAASRAKSQFLANMSHEIRTPLNGVVGMADLLLTTRLDHRQRRYADLVKSSAEILTTLINDVLDFSKIEAGKLDLESIEFNLPQVVEQVAEILAPRAFKKNLELVCDIDPAVRPSLKGDPIRLRQVLINLMNNAIKFTQAGEVTVRVAAEGGHDSRQTLRIAIADTGIGIPPDRMHRLFKSFSQVDSSTTRQYGGTGLGLAISKQLVELMGGSIQVSSEPGRGSTFSFTIDFEITGDAAPAPEDKPSTFPSTALIVEPHQPTREIVCRMLREFKMDVAAASTQAEAVSLLQSRTSDHPLELLLMDESAVGLNRAAIANGTKILLMVKSDQQIDPDRLKSQGIRGYVTKPVTRARLRSALLELNSAPSADSPPSPGNPSPTAARILLAEDNEVNQLVVIDMLANAGLHCHAVPDGARAIEAALSGAFDLILMDCQMPGVDGLEASAAIRKAERARSPGGTPPDRLPIIALTANATGGDRERCIGAGMDAYCTKPIDSVALLATIHSLLKNTAPKAVPAGAAIVTASDAPPATVARAQPPLNMETVLRRCGGKPELAARVLEKFAQQAAEAIAQLQASADKQDADQIARISHSLKGAAGMTSAQAVSESAARLESLGRARDLAHVHELISQLHNEIRLCTEFIAHNKQAGAASASPAGITEVQKCVS